MTHSLDKIQWDGLFPSSASLHDPPEFAGLVAGRSILVTGAGGSIGAALARAIHHWKPHTLVLLDSSEQNLYHIHRDLSALSGATKIVPVIGSVAAVGCVRDVFRRFRPHVVFHAAALKHVPLGEMNPFAVVRNNVFGTATVAVIAQEFLVERLLMISTDKAVNPLSIMGASKRLAEIILLGMGDDATRINSIRLGNVLGSEGSVVPLFLEQIACGGPVTVTDPEVERYFLTMEETVHRVLSAAASCPTESAIAIPLMGKPVKIADLAQYLIAEAAATGVSITFTGLRTGDKLREEFVSERETISDKISNSLQWVRSPRLSDAELEAGLAELNAAMCELDLAKLLATLTRLVPNYQPSAYLQNQIEQAAT
jgi:FlaA1/EpsC-like NDP-sugar epimerase